MTPAILTDRNNNPRFPAEIISQGVWLYYRFCLSYRNGEERLCERGVIVPSEAIRQGCRQFGQQYANQLRRPRPRPGDTWRLGEVGLSSRGGRHDLGCAVDQDGPILDILVQRRHTNAAKKFFRKLRKGFTDVPRVIITDQLKRYGAATRAMRPSVGHRQHRYVHNRAEHAPQPTRPRERRLQGVTSPGQAQRFLSADGPIAPYCRPRRHLCTAQADRQTMSQRFQLWRAITGRAAA